MERRQFLKTTGLTLATAVLGVRAPAQAAPIKVGVLAPLTGVVASGGREMVEGTQFWFDRIKNEISGRKVQLMVEDDASNPDVALQKARRLVEQANVHFLIGNLLANTGLAVVQRVGVIARDGGMHCHGGRRQPKASRSTSRDSLA